MPDDQDQSSDQAPQHVLRAAIIPIKLDMSEADKQIEELETRLTKLSDQFKVSTKQNEAVKPPEPLRVNQPTTQSQQAAASVSNTDLQLLKIVAIVREIADEMKNIRDSIEDLRQ